MRQLLRTLTALALLVAVPMLARPAHAEECGGVSMPSRTKVGGASLGLNGMGIREATMFNVDVYVAGLYVESRSRSPSRILGADAPTRLVLHFVREVDKSDITDAFTEGFESSGKAGALRGKIRKLNSWMSAVDEGDEMVFSYLPGKGLHVRVKGRTRGTIAGADFAKAFFGIWLGSNPPNSGLKRGLLGGSCG